MPNVSNDLTGRVALVTGATSGLGLRFAQVIAASGAKVAVTGRRVDRLEKLAAEINDAGGVAEPIQLDMQNNDSILACVEQAESKLGIVDVLVNNAGAFDGGPIEDIDLDMWNKVIGACMTGTFLATRSAFRIMKNGDGGRILNIGSISAQMPRMYSVPYTAAKHGISGLTKAAALEGRDYGIIVSALHPGNVRVERRIEEGVQTAGSGMASEKNEPMMTVDEIADVALTMLALPGHINFLEAIVLPSEQSYLGRG